MKLMKLFQKDNKSQIMIHPIQSMLIFHNIKLQKMKFNQIKVEIGKINKNSLYGTKHLPAELILT